MTGMNKEAFYKIVRPLWGGRISQAVVGGLEAILVAWDKHGDEDPRKLAYVLGTIYHETGKKMVGVDEIGKGRGKKYGVAIHGQVYYGRGPVQLTWIDNYKKMGKLIGVDLVSSPARVNEPEIGALVTVLGMMGGLFTGRALGDYFNTTTDWYQARRIINKMDRAADIAGYAQQFHNAILAAIPASEKDPVKLTAPEPAAPSLLASVTTWGQTAAGTLGGGTALAAVVDKSNTTITQVKDTVDQGKQVVTVVRENAGLLTSVANFFLSPYVLMAIGAIIVLVAVVTVYRRWKMKLHYGV